jgi:hypothetical protein
VVPGAAAVLVVGIGRPHLPEGLAIPLPGPRDGVTKSSRKLHRNLKKNGRNPIEHVAVLYCPTIGFPNMMTALGWVRDLT